MTSYDSSNLEIWKVKTPFRRSGNISLCLYSFCVFLHSKSRHMVVCYVAKKAGMSHYGYADRKIENNIFMHA